MNRIATLLTALTGLLVACGAPEPAPRWVAQEAAPLDVTHLSGDGRLVLAESIPPSSVRIDGLVWHAASEPGTVSRSGEGGPGVLEVSVERGTAISRIELDVVGSPGRVVLRWVAPGGAWSPEVAASMGRRQVGRRRTLIFRLLPEIERADGLLLRLELSPPAGSRVQLRELRFSTGGLRPGRLAGVAGTVAKVAVDGDWRNARLLVTGRPELWQAGAPSGARLRFAAAVVPGVRGQTGLPGASGVTPPAEADSSVTLRVVRERLWGESVLWESSLPAEGGGWRTMEVPLPRGAARIRFEAEAEPARLVALANPRWLPAAEGTPAVPEGLVLVTLDVVRPDRMSLYGYERETTPELERLARDAAVFDEALTVAPSTPPSMASLMTGLYPFWSEADGPWWRRPGIHHGLTRYFGRAEEVKGLPPAVPTLAQRLREAGLRTGAVVSNAYVNSEFGFPRGFDRFQEFPPGAWDPHPEAGEVVDEALGWLAAGAGEPFFLYLHLMDAHGPYAPPAPWNRFFPGEYLDGDDQRLTTDFLNARESDELRRLEPHASLVFDGALRYADHELGRLWRRLADRGLLDRTIVVVHSDHGEEFLDHGGSGHRGTVYEELVRVALMVRYPPLTAGGRRVAGTARPTDLHSTLLELLGLGSPEGLHSRSLVPQLSGAAGRTDPVFGAFHRRAWVRDGRWKWIRHPDGAEELYDLVADPGETRDLSVERRAVAESLAAAWDGWEAERLAEGVASAGEEGEVTEATLDRLRALGYLE